MGGPVKTPRLTWTVDMSRKPNADLAYHYAASQLSRHLKSCSKCSAAVNARDPHQMCNKGLFAACQAANRFVAATKATWWRGFTKSEHKYVCPDPEAHGVTFTMTATPVRVVAEQPSLF